jgi:hypothetical protein
MMKWVSFGMLASALAAMTGPALAQQQCDCQFEWVEAARAVGTITSVTGDVLVALPSGYGSATEGTAVFRETSVTVGPRSRALISFRGGCSIEARQNTTVSINLKQATGAQQAAVCARVSQSAPGGVMSGPGVPLGIFTGLAGSAALLSLTQKSEDGPPPVSQ